MFGKFKKEDAKSFGKKQEKITTDNILEVFSKDMMDEKKKELVDSLHGKDPLVYLSKCTGVLKLGFFICLFLSVILFSYGYIQKNEEASNLSLLNPICSLFLGRQVAEDYDGCASVASAHASYTGDLKDTKKEQAEKVISILDNVYSVDNFLFTEDISFILEKSSSKLPVLQILSEFNELKDAFEPTKKVYALECNDIVINNDLEVKMSCSTYSSDWSDANIMGFNGQTTSKKISGTSISVASSFINFLSKKGENFQILESTKVYTYGGQIGEGKERYTRRTDFDITLKYINPSAR